MKTIVAKSAGFCYGVKRALDTVLGVAESGGRPLFTLGPLIHNPQVIRKLEASGIRMAGDLSEVPSGSVVVMPTHGVQASVMESASASGIEIVDVTCPFVSNVHKLAENLVKEGYQIVVLGDEGHTEVRGIMSRAGEDAVAISDEESLEGIELKRRVGVLAQTTQSVERYRSLVSAISARVYEVRAFNTICSATMERQGAAVEAAEDVDVMIVVGGRNSANTRRLAEICADTGVPTHHVELAEEIDHGWFRGAARVGITAGASTPDWIIDEVIQAISGIGG